LVEAVFDDSYAKEVWKIPIADNTVGRRISDISADLCYQLIKTSRFALQIG
jgi:hypothetical protein